jgi:uncharacterized membrane protein (DUF373 family)
MLTFLKRFEILIAWVLAILLVLVILLATIDLAVEIIKTVFYVSPHFLVAVDELLKMFGLFLIILLGLELLEMVKAFFQEDVIHVEVVLIVALIALARKVIILELHEPTPGILAGMAALILSVAVSYRLIMRFLTEKK